MYYQQKLCKISGIVIDWKTVEIPIHLLTVLVLFDGHLTAIAEKQKNQHKAKSTCFHKYKKKLKKTSCWEKNRFLKIFPGLKIYHNLATGQKSKVQKVIRRWEWIFRLSWVVISMTRPMLHLMLHWRKNGSERNRDKTDNKTNSNNWSGCCSHVHLVRAAP